MALTGYDAFRADAACAAFASAFNARHGEMAIHAAEELLSAHFGRRHAVLLSGGREALSVAARCLAGKSGARAILPAVTHHSLFDAASAAGLRPLCVDSNPLDLNIDAGAAIAMARPGDIAILPHMFGNVLAADLFSALSRAGVATVEDASQVHMPSLSGGRAGRLGDLAAVSLSEGKPVSGMGFGAGVFLCDSASELAFCRREIKNGRAFRPEAGVAGFIAAKLRVCGKIHHSLGTACAAYRKGLSGVRGVALFEGMALSPQDFPALFDCSTRLRAHFARLSLPLERSYTPIYELTGEKKDSFPVARLYGERSLHLPVMPFMTGDEISALVRAVRAFYEEEA